MRELHEYKKYNANIECQHQFKNLGFISIDKNCVFASEEIFTRLSTVTPT